MIILQYIAEEGMWLKAVWLLGKSQGENAARLLSCISLVLVFSL